MKLLKKLLAALLLTFAPLALGATANNLTFGMPNAFLFGAFIGDSTAAATTLLNTLNDAVQEITTVPATDTITSLCYNQASIAGTPTAAFTFTLETLSSGTASGTRIGGTTATTFTPTAGTSAYVCVSLGANTYSVTAGQELAIVIRHTGATDLVNTLTVNSGQTLTGRNGFPALWTISAGGALTKSGTVTPMLVMQSSTSSYGFPYTGADPFTTGTIQSFGNTVEAGMQFNLPASVCGTYTVSGVHFSGTDPTTTTSNYFASIYGALTTPGAPLAQTSTSLTAASWGSLSFNREDMALQFTSTPTLTGGTTYVVAFATTVASEGSFYNLTVANAADLNAWSFQQQTALVTRTASSFAGIKAGSATGNFTATTTKRPWIELTLASCTNSAGAAGAGGGVY